jgi:hypothetical protein
VHGLPVVAFVARGDARFDAAEAAGIEVFTIADGQLDRGAARPFAPHPCSLNGSP